MNIQPQDFDIATPVYNRSDIMRRANQIARDCKTNDFYNAWTHRAIMAMALRAAWLDAKRKAWHSRPASTRAEHIRAQIATIEAKNLTTPEQRERLVQLRADLHKECASDYAKKRALINNAKGRFCSVVFIKKDGSERVMNVQPAKLAKHVKGDAATDAGKKGTATRKERHPHLFPVWDVRANAPRSINLETIQAVTVNGKTHAFCGG